MSLGRTRAVTLEGVRGRVVEVEADIGSGLPKMVLVGLPDTSLNESKDRCRAAVINSGETWPNRRVTVALSPASLPKSGSQYDLAIALAVLAAAGAVPAEPIRDAVLLGELALDGRLRAVPGVLPATLAAAQAGCRRVMVPEVNATEAGVVDGISVVAVRSLAHAVALLRGEEPPDDPPVPPFAATERLTWPGSDRLSGLDLADVLGQPEARRCVEVSAAGGHHLFLEGPPGAGKTMLAERLPGLLPDLTPSESMEVSAVHSIAGVLPPALPMITRPPFLDPHHTSSIASIVGGGSRSIRPGAMSLAHRGVLFLDEAPEFASHVLEALRQPLESGSICIGRAERTATFPAHFVLVLAANPCPCGGEDDRSSPCACSPAAKRRYRERVSGPVRDRIDIYRKVLRVKRHRMVADMGSMETSALVAARVAAARARQRQRYEGTSWQCNREVPGPVLRQRWPVHKDGATWLEQQLVHGRISARGMDRVLRVAWTVADLSGHDLPLQAHVQAAFAFRVSDPLPSEWPLGSACVTPEVA